MRHAIVLRLQTAGPTGAGVNLREYSIMKLTSGNASTTRSVGSVHQTEFQQDFMHLMLSLQAGNRLEANAAFQAIKQEFQRVPSSSVRPAGERRKTA